MSVLSNGKVAAIFQCTRAVSHLVFIYICVRTHIYIYSAFHRLFVLLLYAFTIPAAAVFFSSSSPLSFSLISCGTDNNNEAERTKTELYMTLLSWHAFIVRTCQKSDGKKKKRKEKKEKDSRLFFVFY